MQGMSGTRYERDGSYSEGGSYNQSYDDVLNPVS